jgi:hypothetical protein
LCVAGKIPKDDAFSILDQLERSIGRCEGTNPERKSVRLAIRSLKQTVLKFGCPDGKKQQRI